MDLIIAIVLGCSLGLNVVLGMYLLVARADIKVLVDHIKYLKDETFK